MAAELGLIGIGLMGSALAERAVAAGFAISGYDIRPDRRAILTKLGGLPVQSAAEAARKCRRIVFSVLTTEQVERTLATIQDDLRRGTIVIDTSTGEPDRIERLAARLKTKGIHYLDATIAGNSAEVRQRDVLVLAGGDARVFTRCRDFFNCFARAAFHLGPAGSGARMKLVFNLVLGLHRAVLAEGLQFAAAIGIPPSLAIQILKAGTAYSRVMDNKGGKMLARDFSPQARLSQHLKDVELILRLGANRGARLPLSSAHRKLLAALVKAGRGGLDNSAIFEAFEPAR